jgi:hypothetical protein
MCLLLPCPAYQVVHHSRQNCFLLYSSTPHLTVQSRIADGQALPPALPYADTSTGSAYPPLPSDGSPQAVTVMTAQQFVSALERGAALVTVNAHLDLRGLPPILVKPTTRAVQVRWRCCLPHCAGHCAARHES